MINEKTPILISDDLSNKINNSTLQKMIFLYNSIQNGWTIRKLSNNKYELKQNTTKEIRNDNYIFNSIIGRPGGFENIWP